MDTWSHEIGVEIDTGMYLKDKAELALPWPVG